jgi:hypothetical protein
VGYDSEDGDHGCTVDRLIPNHLFWLTLNTPKQTLDLATG